MPLKKLLDDHDITQREFAEGIGRSDTLVSRLISGALDPSKNTIDKSLAFLTKRLGRTVTYEEAFADPTAVAHGR